MPMYFSPAQVERLKREAKQLARRSGLTHSQALDQIAVAKGHANWSLLMKHNATPSVGATPPFQFVRTPTDMQMALRKVPEPKFGSREGAARSLVDDICRDFVSARNAVEFSIEYLDCLLSVPRFKVSSSAKVYWEMHCWLPYAAMPLDEVAWILVNRHYKPLGQTTDAWADYAKFNHLHFELEPAQVGTVSAFQSSDGYFFDDGCPPWHSRKDAKAYRQRLSRLHSALTGGA